MKGFTLDLTEDEVVLLLRGLALVGVFGRFGEEDDVASSRLWKKITFKTRVKVEGEVVGGGKKKGRR